MSERPHIDRPRLAAISAAIALVCVVVLTLQIRDLTGIPESRAVEVSAEEPSFTSDLQDSAMADTAVQNDRGIQEAENERAARQHTLRGAHLSYWPTVDLLGQYSVLSKINNYDQYYKNFQRNNVNFGVQITIPLFSAKTRSNVALAKSELDAAELLLGSKRQGVRVEVQEDARQVRELDAGREVARLDQHDRRAYKLLLMHRKDQSRPAIGVLLNFVPRRSSAHYGYYGYYGGKKYQYQQG